MCVTGTGKLTQNVMNKLQKYYTWAIRSHKNDLEGMHRAVWATYYHVISTDERPQHDLCPDGIDTWCFYKQAVAYDDDPQTKSHDHGLGTVLSVEVSLNTLCSYLILFIIKPSQLHNKKVTIQIFNCYSNPSTM